MRILFLDYDGVLNTPRNWGDWNDSDKRRPPVAPELSERLREFVERHDITVVIHSTWRSVCERDAIVAATGEWLDARLHPTWRTDDGHKPTSIRQWLYTHFKDDHPLYVVLDDDDMETDGRQVWINLGKGISDADLERAAELLCLELENK